MISDSPFKVVTNRRGWIYVTPNKADQLMLHLTKSPISIVMYNCEQFVMKSIANGIYKNTTECTDLEFTHTSVVVGYGETPDGEKYWEILNSYGE